MNSAVWRASIVRTVFLLILLAATASAQRSLWKSYGRPQGLRELNVNCMYQDHEGFLWVGTENGLYRYDGKRFLRFTKSDGLSDTYVSALESDANGNLWVGTATGISVRAGGRFEPLKGGPVAHGVRKNSSLVAWNSGMLLVSSQTLWYGEYRPATDADKPGLLTLKQFMPEQLPPGQVTSIFKDWRGNLWGGCNGSICELSRDHWQRWELPAGLAADSWSDLLESAEGGLVGPEPEPCGLSACQRSAF